MTLLAAALVLQAAASAQQAPPVLQFPEPGIDDPAAYQGYQTRFHRDAAGNTLQIYIDQRDGRVVGVWGNAANESLGFTARDSGGSPAPITWGAGEAIIDAQGRRRSVEYRLHLGVPEVQIGHFLLGSMRVERDYQHFEHHRQPFDAPPFARPELTALTDHLGRLDARERRKHLALLRARNVDALRERIHALPALSRSRTESRVRVQQPSFDGRNALTLELRVPRRDAEMTMSGGAVAIRSRTGSAIPLVVRVSTDAEPLTPLRYTEIFNERFLDFYHALRAERDRIQQVAPAARTAADEERVLAFRRTERQVLSLELLSSHEKLMAGLPNYGTYFGRDMLMSALMMEPVWSDRMSEYVIGSVLGKLSPTGEVSHEEALGGQAVREHATLYNGLMDAYLASASHGTRQVANDMLTEARRVLADLQRVRENYHMLDDDFQFPVFVAGYLADPAIPAEQKRAFLMASVPDRGGSPHLVLLLRNLAYVARATDAYVRDPRATNLIAFPPRTETDWFPGSWRDSNVGYANGRFAMDINVVWVPAALESIGRIAAALRDVGLDMEQLVAAAPEIRQSPLAEYLRTPQALARAVAQWRGTERHFRVTLNPAEARARVEAKLAWMPEEERRFWSEVLQRSQPTHDLRFLALSLDAAGHPIPVVNTDVATRFFVDELADGSAGTLPPDQVLDDVRAVMLPFPVGLMIPAIGPVVANDAYASPEVWEAFRRDHYHSPRVVWGREVNLLLLGLAKQIEAASNPAGAPRRPELAPYLDTLRQALAGIRDAVEASGLEDQELWSYRIEDGRLLPLRYAASTDLQLWNLTALAVQYRLSRLPAVEAVTTAP